MRAAALALLLWTGTAAAEAPRIGFAPVPLDPDRPTPGLQIGRFTHLGTLELSVRDAAGERVSGWSGLEMQYDSQMVAVSDTGHWMTFRPERDGRGHLRRIVPGEIGRLAGLDGEPLGPREWRDAEAVRRLPDGGMVVSFEVRDRLWRYQADLRGAARAVPPPAGLHLQPINGGVEALAVLPDGRWVALSEAKTDGDTLVGWLREADGTWADLRWPRDQWFAPVEAAALPDGDLLVLERRFSWLGGFAVRLMRVTGRTIRAGARLEPEQVLLLEPPLVTENYEGMAIQPEGPNSVLLWLIVDDNLHPLQRTLLTLFRYTL